jgi:hypothetical protein
MLVTIEDAPDLVVGAPVPFSRITSFGPPRLNCSLDELQGAASVGIDLDAYPIAVLAAPVREVQLFGTKALGEHEQIEHNCRP